MTAKQLRNSILQMAIQGKLVPQNPADEPASALFEKIRKEKQRLIKEGKIKRDKNESVIFRGSDKVPGTEEGRFYEKIGNGKPVDITDELPFEIPASWEWARLEEISEKIHYGFTASATSTGNAQLLRITDIQNNSVDWRTVPYCDVSGRENEAYRLRTNDILIARTGGTIGKSFIVKDTVDNAVFASYLIRVVPSDLLIALYIKLFLESPLYWVQLKSSIAGTGQPNVNGRSLMALLVPVPPYNEQINIVKKIEELSPRIEGYEEIEVNISELNTTFPATFKKSILQSAIQGKLVPQDPNDEPASVLLQKIHRGKEKLIKAGKIKKPKTDSFIFRRDGSWWEKTGKTEKCIDDEIPFEIPESWEWARLGEIIMKIDYGTSKKSLPFGKIPVLRMQNIQNGKIDYTSLAYTDDENDINKYKLEKNDLLFNRTNSAELVGKVAIYDAKYDAIFAGYLIRFRMFTMISPLFINYLMQSTYYDAFCKNTKTLGVSQANINAEKLKSFLVPIPPTNEQKRIVDKVSQFMEMDQNFRSALNGQTAAVNG